MNATAAESAPTISVVVPVYRSEGTLREFIVAFATLWRNSAEEGEGVLFGIAPEAQGLGLYRSLMIGAMLWFRTRGTTRMVVSTRVTNVAVQKVWTRLGFEPLRSLYTFHKWFLFSFHAGYFTGRTRTVRRLRAPSH